MSVHIKKQIKIFIPPSAVYKGRLSCCSHHLWTKELCSYCCKTCNTSHRAGPTIPKRMEQKISQQQIFMVFRISRGKAKVSGNKVLSSPTALCLFPSSTSPPLLHTDVLSADCLQHPQSKCTANSQPNISPAKHSMGGCSFNERETH